MIIVIDHYDSFVFNIAHYLEMLGAAPEVIRFDEPGLAELVRRKAHAVVLSPGPCSPTEADDTVALIRREAGRLPILGVCLGHQCIGAAFDVPVIAAPEPVHGSPSVIRHKGDPLFEGIPDPFPAGRYHSLVLPAEAGLLGPLHCIAHTEDGVNMAVRHRRLPIVGIQFHPESVLTPHGMVLLGNFLRQYNLLETPQTPKYG